MIVMIEEWRVSLNAVGQQQCRENLDLWSLQPLVWRLKLLVKVVNTLVLALGHRQVPNLRLKLLMVPKVEMVMNL
jgi:hypothetical protein